MVILKFLRREHVLQRYCRIVENRYFNSELSELEILVGDSKI